MPAIRPRITLITPVFNEEAGLRRYADTVTRVLFARNDASFEVLFIDDGSSDCSWDLLTGICRHDPRFRALRLSRNFGAHAAIAAGFHHTDADAAAILACDLQDPPEVIIEFVERWRQGAKIVFGHRRSREDSWWRSLLSRGFNQLLARHALPRGSQFASGSFLLCDRQVVECYRQMPEHNVITFASVAWTGFRQARVDYDRVRRTSGKSGWSTSRLFSALYDVFISYSRLPIRIFVFLSVSSMLFALGLSLFAVLNYFLKLHAQPGWTSLAVLTSFLLGLQFFLLGILGEYLHRIHAEVMRRPRYFVCETAPGPQGS